MGVDKYEYLLEEADADGYKRGFQSGARAALEAAAKVVEGSGVTTDDCTKARAVAMIVRAIDVATLGEKE